MHATEPTTVAFDYDEAFSRNIGWVTHREQSALRRKRVAIAGAGGVGGVHALALARLGIGNFHLADPDVFELVNFNRQAGATMSTLGRSKAAVMRDMVLEINPTAEIETFGAVTADNVDAFLCGVDLYVDGLDFFVPAVRELVFARCAALGIPAITAGPLGMSVAFVIFMPGRMTFEDFFGFANQPEDEQLARFMVGLAPGALHIRALADPTAMSLTERRGASMSGACDLCAGVVALEAAKILTGRGRVRAAPWCHQLDVFSGRWRSRRSWLGYRNPLSRLRLAVVKKLVARLESRTLKQTHSVLTTDLARIAEAARWAPSADNTQPWTFTLHEPGRLDVQLIEDHGLPRAITQLAAGALIENVRLAGLRFGRVASWTVTENTVSIDLSERTTPRIDPLARFIERRATDRRAYRRRLLTSDERVALEGVVDSAFEIRWLTTLSERWPLIRATVRATAARLTRADTFAQMQSTIEFGARYSAERMPSGSLGLSALSLALTQWLFKRFGRMRAVARMMGSVAHLETVILPGIASGAHFALVRRGSPDMGGASDMHAGIALQRVWLKATELGLVMQPVMGPLIMGPAGPESDREHIAALTAKAVAVPFEQIVALARIGEPAHAVSGSRALRRPLVNLVVETA